MKSFYYIDEELAKKESLDDEDIEKFNVIYIETKYDVRNKTTEKNYVFNHWISFGEFGTGPDADYELELLRVDVKNINKKYIFTSKKKAIEHLHKIEEKKKNTCPNCGGKIVLRTNKRTGEKFYGCSNFPKCYYARSLDGSYERYDARGEDWDNHDYDYLVEDKCWGTD